jgi:tight adherence protein B
MNISPLVFVVIVVAVLFGAEGIHTLVRTHFSSDQAKARKRLRTLAAQIDRGEAGADEEESLLRSDTKPSWVDNLIDAIPGIMRLRVQLYCAGLTMTPKRFLAISFGLAGLGYVVATIFTADPVLQMLAMGVGLMPWINAGRLGRKRLGEFERQFPDALDLLIRSLRAGHSLSVGLQMVAEELPDPISREFSFVADEVRIGKTVPAALAHLATRMPAPDLPFFVVAVAIQQETGSNLAEVLQNLSSVIRDRFQLYGKVNALTAMGKATANLLVCWPGVMVGALYVVNPDYIRPLWETPEGHTMMMIAAVMIVIGYVICRRMATIKV